MDKVNDNIIVALIPNETGWCKIEFPHTTLIYVGKVQETKETWLNELAKAASSLSMLASPFYLKISGIEIMGEEERVDVLRLIPTPELLAMRSFLMKWDSGEFPVYLPHATIGPVGSSASMDWRQNSFDPNVPSMPIALYFDRIAVCWGETRLNFWLRKS